METIRPATTRTDLDQATALVGDYVEWLRTATRLDPIAAQPAMVCELRALCELQDEPDSTILIASVDDVPVGTVAVRRHDDGSAELARMYVRPVARGRGLAGRLIDHALETAASHGCHTTWLETLPGVMDSAIALYRRHGFVDADPERGTLGLDGVLVMARPLGGQVRGAGST